MIDEVKFPENKKYLAAVSGGPDSMALLDILIKEGYDIQVVHVNYHTRKESDLEEEIVSTFCTKNHIKCHIHHADLSLKKGNFEAWARVERYSFFQQVYLLEKMDGIFVAHQKDDLLETYLMQKRRNAIVKYYGIPDENYIFSMNVYRPLLSFDKEELLSYCQKNKVPYSIDVSNQDNRYTRNKIRNKIISKMNIQEKNNLFEEIANLNKKNELLIKIHQTLILEDIHSLTCFDDMNIEQVQLLIHEICSHVTKEEIKISKTKTMEIIKLLNSDKTNASLSIKKNIFLIKEYGKWKITTLSSTYYEYIMEKPSKIDVEEFSCDFTIDTSFLKIYPSSYPLKIRNAKKGDVVYFGDVKKKINRIFIDNKIPPSKRNTYPVVEDKNGKIVYIPLYKSNQQKNIANKLCFMLK